MRRLALIVVACTGLLLVGCGESDQDKAKSQVCDARADIGKQVDELTGLTITTASVSQIQQSLKAISGDLKKITDAQGNLDPDRKTQVENANKTFASQVQKTAQDVVGGLGSGDAKAQLQSAVDDLAAAYKSAFAPIDCS
jgi:Tfp pilus assembly protein PilP